MTTVDHLECYARLVGTKRSIFDLMLRRGKHFSPVIECPKKLRGPKGCCYMNAAKLMMDYPQMTYCEGYACALPLGFVTEHAWVIDRGGAVIDSTWEGGCDYFGLAFRTSFVMREMLRTKHYGLLGPKGCARQLVESPAALKQALSYRAMRRGIRAADLEGVVSE